MIRYIMDTVDQRGAAVLISTVLLDLFTPRWNAINSDQIKCHKIYIMALSKLITHEISPALTS